MKRTIFIFTATMTLTFFVTLLWASIVFMSCAAPLPPKSIAAIKAVECRFALLEPYLGALTADLVGKTLSGDSTSLPSALMNLGLTPVDVQQIANEWRACGSKPDPEPLPTPEPEPQPLPNPEPTPDPQPTRTRSFPTDAMVPA